MRPTDAKFLFDFLLPQFRSEHAVTLRIIRAVPDGGRDYKPGPKAMSAFELLRHIAICELWFLDAMIHGAFDEGTAPPAEVATSGELADWYAASVATRLGQLEQVRVEDLAREIDYIGLRNDPAVAYLNIAIRHSVHHRGQLAAYLRGMGAAVPAIYVESADEPYPPEDGSTVTPPAF
jgi:uncharacterized damage-inducible protein DinB